MQMQLLWIVSLTLAALAQGSPRTYELWAPEPAPNRGRTSWERTKNANRPNSDDRDWEHWSYLWGNGYIGACVFGRTDTERVQITDKTLHNQGKYGKGGLTSFAELYLDFNQDAVQNYRRSLSLNEAIAHVSYEQGGVGYQREYFASYPDNVLVIFAEDEAFSDAQEKAVKEFVRYFKGKMRVIRGLQQIKAAATAKDTTN